jgi:hypothetical protein
LNSHLLKYPFSYLVMVGRSARYTSVNRLILAQVSLFLLLSFSAFSQVPGSSQYPTSLDTNTTLLVAANACSTILNGAINNSVTSITVNSQTCFPSTGIFSVESEYFIYTASTSTTFTVTRGAFGSAAASHATSTPVRLTVMSAYHNVLKDGLIAAQTKLGSGSDTAASNEVLVGTGAGTSGWAKLVNANVDSAAAIAITKLNITGTPDGSKFLRDDGSWQTASGTGITALTGDVTASGSGSVAATLATVNSNVGSFTNANITVNAKGLITAAANGSGGSAAWSALTDPSGNLSLAMAANLTTLTYAGNFSTSSAFKLAGNNTSATGPLLHLTTAASNLIPPLLVEVRGSNQRLKVGHLGDVMVGQAAIGSTDTDGFPYVPVVGSNSFPTSTPTGQTGMAPIVAYSNGINTEYDLAIYLNSKWNSIGGARKRYDTASGTGAQSLDFNSNAGGVVSREYTATGNSTLTFSNPPPAGSLVVVTIIQGGAGSFTITWPATVKWTAATAPTLTTTAGKRDTFVFMWNGSSYYNTSQQLNQ